MKSFITGWGDATNYGVGPIAGARTEGSIVGRGSQNVAWEWGAGVGTGKWDVSETFGDTWEIHASTSPSNNTTQQGYLRIHLSE